MRWLILSPYLPHSGIGHGGGTCVFDLCRNLAKDHDVQLLCFQRSREVGLERELEGEGVAVHTVPFLSDQARGLERLRLRADRFRCLIDARRRSEPYMVTKYRRQAMFGALSTRLHEFRPQVLQVEYGFMGAYAEHAKRVSSQMQSTEAEMSQKCDTPPTVVLLNTHELVTLARLRNLARENTRGRRRGLQREVAMASRYESQLSQWADTVLCVTEQDRVLLHAMSGASNLRTVPLGSDVDRLPVSRLQNSDPPYLLFVGSFGHPPNLGSALHLLEEVMPRVWGERPEVRVDIVGGAAPAMLREACGRAGERVVLHGFVEDLGPLFDRCSLFAAPLLEGGGIKIKILEAMARGAAVITTPVGAEGIDEDGEALRILPGGSPFAHGVLELLEDENARQTLAGSARRHIESSFSWDSIVDQLTRCVHEVATHQDSARG
jgi:glycosyltransferase involved in cell wall biosynthesis